MDIMRCTSQFHCEGICRGIYLSKELSVTESLTDDGIETFHFFTNSFFDDSFLVCTVVTTWYDVCV